MKAPIVTLTMNPAVDLSASIDRIVPSHKMRCEAAQRDAGGGGINVARAIRRLGGEALALFPSGGPTGMLLENLLRAEGVAFRTMHIVGETREDFAISERATGNQFRFVLPGPSLSAVEANACLEALDAAITGSAFVVASGSLPPGLPEDFYGRVARVATAHGARFVLDTSGRALKSALGQGLFLIKPSKRELSELIGMPLPDRDACLEAAEKVVKESGADFVAVSLGEDGAIFVGHGLALTATAPVVTTVSSVGAGDSFLAAMVLALSQGREAKDALRSAVASGTAALLHPGTGLCDPDRVVALKDQVCVTRMRSPALSSA